MAQLTAKQNEQLYKQRRELGRKPQPPVKPSETLEPEIITVFTATSWWDSDPTFEIPAGTLPSEDPLLIYVDIYTDCYGGVDSVDLYIRQTLPGRPNPYYEEELVEYEAAMKKHRKAVQAYNKANKEIDAEEQAMLEERERAEYEKLKKKFEDKS